MPQTPTGAHGRILVIKLGALGDFVQALGPCAAIRRHHAAAHITLLTTAAFVPFARQSPYFDDVWTDDRPRLLDIVGWLRLRRRLREGRFDRVYDLQTSDRSSLYYRLMREGGRLEWSGIARGASHRDTNPARDRRHTIERQRAQLAQAGIDDVPLTDLGWVEADTGRFALPEPYALLVPGGAAHRPAKRWPQERFTTLAGRMARLGITPVLLGARGEAASNAAIAAAEPRCRDLTGETDFADIVGLARRSAYAVGNDTGPMHLIAMAGARAVVLFSAASNPDLCAPRAPENAPPVTVLQEDNLAALPVARVLTALPAHPPGVVAAGARGGLTSR